jgi:hypothetical protein
LEFFSVVGIDENIHYCIQIYIYNLKKKKNCNKKFVINKNNKKYNTSEGQKVFQKKIFTPFKTALIKAKHLYLNK